MISSLKTLFFAVSLSLVSLSSRADELAVKITRPEKAASISPTFLGAQYNYSEGSIVTQLTNQNLLQSWRNVPIQVMRYPGGTWGDHYIWDNPEGSYFAAGNAQTVASPEKFIESCRQIGSEPIFQVNIMAKGKTITDRVNPTKIEDIRQAAKRAARWVESANIINHWNVKYWEIGNEVWIWLSPQEYANYVVEFSKAMKAVDPSIKIIACGLSSDLGPFNAKWLTFADDPNWKPRTAVKNNADDWNRALLTQASGYFDFVAPHIYIDAEGKDLSTESRYLEDIQTILQKKQLNNALKWKKAMGDGVKLAVTEWGCNFSQSVPGSGGYKDGLFYYSLANGLNTALLFGEFVKEADGIDLTILHCLDDIQTMWFWPKNELAKGEPLHHPPYLAMEVWGNHLGAKSLDLVTGPLPTMKIKDSSCPSLFLYSSEDSKHVYLVAVNLDPRNDQNFTVSADASIPLQSAASSMWMTGDDLSSDNFGAWNDAQPPKVALKYVELQANNGVWSIHI
jgi:alpha-L-arabinofuranosidase